MQIFTPFKTRELFQSKVKTNKKIILNRIKLLFYKYHRYYLLSNDFFLMCIYIFSFHETSK